MVLEIFLLKGKLLFLLDQYSMGPKLREMNKIPDSLKKRVRYILFLSVWRGGGGVANRVFQSTLHSNVFYI